MAKRKDRFVVGIRGEDECIYGDQPELKGDWTKHTDPVTIKLAKAMIRQLKSENNKFDFVVYELVPYKPKRKGAKR